MRHKKNSLSWPPDKEKLITYQVLEWSKTYKSSLLILKAYKCTQFINQTWTFIFILEMCFHDIFQQMCYGWFLLMPTLLYSIGKRIGSHPLGINTLCSAMLLIMHIIYSHRVSNGKVCLKRRTLSSLHLHQCCSLTGALSTELVGHHMSMSYWVCLW